MIKPYYQDEWGKQYCSDALKVLTEVEGNSLDLLATDPPYGISFMGKDWDRALPDIKVWQECLRVLKDGAFAFVMSIPRADCLSRMIISLEDAGFWVNFTPIFWAYASGFPKAQNIGKVVDKRLGVKRKRVMTTHTDMFGDYQRTSQHMSGIGKAFGDEEWESGSEMVESTIPASPPAKALDGSYGGFQPKPAVEVVIVAMKPLSEKTFVDQALKNQKGISWLDDCRIPTGENLGGGGYQNREGTVGSIHCERKVLPKDSFTQPQGRFPANLLVSDDVLDDGRASKSHGGGVGSGDIADWGLKSSVMSEYPDSGSFSRYFDLDKWWAKTFPFLIVPKASKNEKDKGLGEFKNEREIGSKFVGGNYPDGENRPLNRFRNIHPTVKPLKLMSYLIMLGSREGDVVLDPFMGSGTTALASKLMGRKCIGIEIEKKYCEISVDRCRQMVFNFGDTLQRDGSAEPEFYQFLLDNKDNPEFMEGVKL